MGSQARAKPAGHRPTAEVSQPPFRGPYGSGLAAAEPTAAGTWWFLDSGPLAPASVYFWSHS